MPEYALQAVRTAEAQAAKIRREAEEEGRRRIQAAEQEGEALLAQVADETERDIREKHAYMMELSDKLARGNREEAEAQAQAIVTAAQPRLHTAVKAILEEMQRSWQSVR